MASKKSAPKPKFQLHGLDADGWSLFIPATETNRFITFLRKKTAFTVEVGISRATPMGQPAEDCFTLPERFTEEQIRSFITDFGAEFA